MPYEPVAVAPPRLQLNARVPDFEAETTHGPLRLFEWHRDKWVILFSHPSDFTPICTTELLAFAAMDHELSHRNVALLGISIDSLYSHLAWVRSIKENFGVDITFPIIADVDKAVSRLYGMLDDSSSANTTVRSIFFIDPDRILRAMIHYPLDVGRSFDEILRVIDALQTVDLHGVACPANWHPGDDVFVPPPRTTAELEDRLSDASIELTDWYLGKKGL